MSEDSVSLVRTQTSRYLHIHMQICIMYPTTAELTLSARHTLLSSGEPPIGSWKAKTS